MELAPLRDPDLVPQAVASALGLKEQPGRRLAETLIDHLRLKHLLLVLDNAEHLLAACAQLVDALLRECPDVATLVTSRERLGIRGEATYRVPSLSIPGTQSDADAKAVVDCESVRLFEERVRLHRPHFAVTDQNSAAIANICRRLDGIALAIELAAARVRSMSIEDINRRLDQRLAVLSEPSRTLPLRQQTLRAAIDWSFDLLSEPEKALFCATSAFVGGFTLEAAEQVCAGETVEAREVLELVAALVDKSLVVVEERDGTTRYRLLETVQQYAEHRLHALPDGRHVLRAPPRVLPGACERGGATLDGQRPAGVARSARHRARQPARGAAAIDRDVSRRRARPAARVRGRALLARARLSRRGPRLVREASCRRFQRHRRDARESAQLVRHPGVEARRLSGGGRRSTSRASRSGGSSATARVWVRC